jgi:para-nitrobenzyl esterase
MIQAVASLLGALVAMSMADEAASKGRAATKSAAGRTPTDELRIDSGAIRGLIAGDKKDIRVYKGIPYAAPPVGEKRWKPPQPPAAWKGVRDCFEFGACCPQKVAPLFGSIPQLALNAPLNEDCLYLNVWTPAKSTTEKLPVLYWIHGGGFVMGAASQPLYEGEELARLGCVVVSINYRLGLFGFIAHPALSQESSDKVSGNYGLLDQIEGLRWVKRNIAAFGGDPSRVTIFGESAGGMSVLSLMVAPQAKGLFHRAIVQSAVVMNLVPLRDAPAGAETAEQAGQRFMMACGLEAAADANKMRGLDAKKLVQASPGEPIPRGALRLKPGQMIVAPVIDGNVIPANPDLLFASGRQHAVPLIIGNTKDEMAIFHMTTNMPADETAYMKKLKDEFGDLGATLATAYPAQDSKQIRAAVIQLTSDLSFVGETRFIARAHSAIGQPTFRYQFSRGTKIGLLQNLGAHHGAEIAFVFQHPAGRDDETEMRISRALGRYWVNFAETGNPSNEGGIAWPVYRADAERFFDFADAVRVLNGDRNQQLDLVDKVMRAPGAVAGKKAEE